jgi:hypothetical protein
MFKDESSRNAAVGKDKRNSNIHRETRAATGERQRVLLLGLKCRRISASLVATKHENIFLIRNFIFVLNFIPR